MKRGFTLSMLARLLLSFRTASREASRKASREATREATGEASGEATREATREASMEGLRKPLSVAGLEEGKPTWEPSRERISLSLRLVGVLSPIIRSSLFYNQHRLT